MAVVEGEAVVDERAELMPGGPDVAVAPEVIAGFDVLTDGSVRLIDRAAEAMADDVAWRWLHLDPAAAEVRTWLALAFPASVAQALLQYETRPRCEIHGSGMILNLRGINRNPGAEPDDMVALRLWVTSRLVLTTRYRRVEAADRLLRQLRSGDAPASPGEFLALLTESLSEEIDALAVDLSEQVDALEDSTEEHGLPGDEVAALRATIIRLRRFVGPQREALARLARVGMPLVDEVSQAEFLEAADITAHAIEELDTAAQRLGALHDFENARVMLLMARHNNILSIVAAIFLPLGFITGLFGMNLRGIPFADSIWGFGEVTLLSLALGVLVALALWLMRWF